jgi:predicted deacetylase
MMPRQGPIAPDALCAALDAAAAPVTFFIRDDDAGWADERLIALLRTVEAAGVPIDLAAIPAALTPSLARELRARREGGQRIGIHQHGFAHVNHETALRKCEFGPARSLVQREADLRWGQEKLAQLFGDALDPIFTPPWNRLAVDTVELLAGLGFTRLSRNRGADPQHVMQEISVHCDWSRHWRLAGEDALAAAQRIALDLAEHAVAGASVGLMLHHATMSVVQLELLSHALAAWARHPNARWRAMEEL